MSEKRCSLLVLAIPVLATLGCAARSRPAELVALEKLRADPTLRDADRRAFDLLAEADDLLLRAHAAWDRRDAYAARRDALMGQIKMKTALAILQAEYAQSQGAQLDEKLAIVSDEDARLEDQLAIVSEGVDLLEKLRATKAAAAQERKTMSEQMASAKQQAVTERQKLADQLSSQQRRAEALDGIRRAELALRTAETVQAPRYAKVKYVAATNMLQEAHKEFDAGRWDEALARTALAQSEADGGIAVARPQYERTAELVANRARDAALEADASALSGVKLRLERDGDLQRLVVVLGGLFADKQSVLLPEGAKTLDSVKELLANYPSYPVQVAGFTDDQGVPKDLAALSLARANAVYWALVTRGIDPKRLNVDGKGREQPVADNGTAGGRARNARIELSILYHVAQ
jgi:outer membrane protein OmpA-like peptidoglycan-associated protein